MTGPGSVKFAKIHSSHYWREQRSLESKLQTKLSHSPLTTYCRIWLHEEGVDIFCSVANELESNEASYVAILQEIYSDSNGRKLWEIDLAFVLANFNSF
jgi:hypothetical protein